MPKSWERVGDQTNDRMDRFKLIRNCTFLALFSFALISCQREEAIKPLEGADADGVPKIPYRLVEGNPSCYAVACVGTMTCGTGNGSGAAFYDWNSCAPNFCAGGISFQRGATSSTYGPWYYIVPLGQTGTFQRLKVRFRGDFNGRGTVGTYNPSTKTWTIAQGNGSFGRFHADVVTSHPNDCW